MEAVKMPSFKLPKIALPRPTRWDLIAIGALVLGLVLIAVNLGVAARQAGKPFPAALAPVFIFAQLVVACGGLMLLGKTAKEGTWWGNLASLGSLLIGMGGVLLAIALWAAA